jgi:Mrp family chromosome partitioning ATPase/capsular polysaccharide biosynthesis protein
VNDGTSLLWHFGRMLRRRKLALLGPMLIVPAAALVLALHKPGEYAASSQVLLSQQPLAEALAGLPVADQSDRSVVTQAGLARVPAIARAVLDRVPESRMTARDFLAASAVTSELDSDLLDFTVRAPTPRLAMRLAAAYAEQYKRYRQHLDASVFSSALQHLDRRLREVRSAGGSAAGALAKALAEREQQLSTLAAFGGTTSAVVHRPDSATQVEPRPLRALALGLALGLVLAVGLALLWEELDTRVRSGDEIAAQLGMPLLARVPTPATPVEEPQDLVMLAGGRAHDVEPVRILRANLEIVNLRQQGHSIMLTSGLDGEGTSTTAANLAIALARVGGRVALVDLNGRHPALHRLFGLGRRAGVIDVVLGSTTLDCALVHVDAHDPIQVEGERAAPVAGLGGELWVLPFGDAPGNAAEFVLSSTVADLLAALLERVTLVLIDAPPLLVSGEAVALTSRVDGVVVVANQRRLRRRAVGELARLLASARARTLGVVVTGVPVDDLYGYESAYARTREPAVPRPSAGEVGT